MTNLIAILFIALSFGGCAHKELKAPCKNIATLAPGSIPCDQREPINTSDVPSVFARP